MHVAAPTTDPTSSRSRTSAATGATLQQPHRPHTRPEPWDKGFRCCSNTTTVTETTGCLLHELHLQHVKTLTPKGKTAKAWAQQLLGSSW